MSLFNPYTFDYKSYLKEMYGLVGEMPSQLPDGKFALDNFFANNQEGVRIEKEAEFVSDIALHSFKFRVFKEVDSQTVIYSLLEEDTPTIAVQYSYEQVNKPIKGIENRHAWNSIRMRGMFREFFDKFIIPHHSVILSDQALTRKGLNLWKQLFDRYVVENKTHKMVVIDAKTGSIISTLQAAENMIQYWESDKFNLRFVLIRKE
jgi:hypothetical protein